MTNFTQSSQRFPTVKKKGGKYLKRRLSTDHRSSTNMRKGYFIGVRPFLASGDIHVLQLLLRLALRHLTLH
jgi:hypothetical protein